MNALEVALILLAVFVVYVLAKVMGFMRQSERQWGEVDKTKLKQWDDDEE